MKGEIIKIDTNRAGKEDCALAHANLVLPPVTSRPPARIKRRRVHIVKSFARVVM